MLDLTLNFLHNTGFFLADERYVLMLAIGCLLVYLGAAKRFEPLLLIPIGLGVIIGNIPFFEGFGLGIYEDNSVLHYLYFGVTSGVYPSIVFLGLGAMTDFSSLLAMPRLMLLGAAAQVGVFFTLLSALGLGFLPNEAASIAIIGGADGPTSIFLTAKLAPHLIGPIAIAAYSYMALIPVIQPPIMRLLTSRKERLIRMPNMREVSKKERMIFPVVGIMLCCLTAPASIPLLGPFFFGNFLKECGEAERLAQSARTVIMDAATIFLGMTVGASTQANVFLTPKSVGIFALGAVAFSVATASGIIFAKLMNLLLKQKINPLLGAAGVSAVPGSAREVHMMGQHEDKGNYLLMHAMACNSSGVIGSACAAGILWSFMVG
ncbi:sodium ion-translocating decarboxylase subunit beta [Desulfosudis oleivorans]|uniref:Sodium ion-translocating decarboxylase, beta subunit n=1 Tax=Desulfosudis oleivorans (strain DSM 6200 / JCM 39069 / Hxd3) TaxID=96561 RepID=A8ZUZ6_DESOH|nr:sodium ion-translocating decarboxylase subunit beta [Desulfosudis oleivorans]ABW68086.1 sodium ion-translocating decarboxylase, beta subunit [Desulfosudis oleivorans Hxd3]